MPRLTTACSGRAPSESFILHVLCAPLMPGVGAPKLVLMNDDSTLDEFCEDFGAPPLSSAELDAQMERARLTSDVQLRRLVKEAQLHRWLLPQLLERAEQISVGSEDQLIKLARFFVRGEGAIG